MIINKSEVNYVFEKANFRINTITEIIKHKKKKIDIITLLENYRSYIVREFYFTEKIFEETGYLITDYNLAMSVMIYCLYKSRSYKGFCKKLKEFRFSTNMYVYYKIYNILVRDRRYGIITKTMILPEIEKILDNIKCETCYKCLFPNNIIKEKGYGCYSGFGGTCKKCSKWIKKKGIKLEL